MVTGARSRAGAKRAARSAESPGDPGGAAPARELAEAREQQAAASEILRVINRSRADAQPVFDAIARSAARLCHAEFCHVFRFDGELIHFAAHHGLAPEGVEAVRSAYPIPPGRASAAARAIMARAVEEIPDVHADPEYRHGSYARVMTFRSVAAVPMLQDGVPIGAIAVARPQIGVLPEGHLELLRTFADQAVIAVENARQFHELVARNRDLAESLEQQTATSEILGVISRSQTDVQPVFEAIVASACALCDASFSGVFLLADGKLEVAATAGLSPAEHASMHAAYPQPVGRGTAAGVAVSERRIVQVADMANDPQFAAAPGRLVGVRTVLSLPMIRNGEVIGAMSVWRKEVRPFTDAQVALFQTFADQAVIAIENVRLFNELGTRNRDLTEALEQQTATSEVLKVISRSAFDLQPVLDTVIENAARLCGAEHGHVHRYDGKLLRLAAGYSTNPAMLDYLRENPAPLGRGSISGLAGLERRAIHWHDVLDIPGYQRMEAQKLGHFRTMLGVPMLRGNELLGVMVIWKTRVEPFSERQIEFVTTFADQAVIAIENVRMFNELETRNRDLTESLDRQTATSEILRVISQSHTDVQPVFQTIATAAFSLCQASSANVFTFDGELLHHAANAMANPVAAEAMRRLYPRPPSRDLAAPRAVLTGGIVVIPDVLEDPDYLYADVVIPGGFRSILGVPLMRGDATIGAITVGRDHPGTFPEAQIELLRTFADQAVIAIENVRLFNELEARTAALTRSVGELRALGEVGQAVSSTLDLETVLRTIVARAVPLAGSNSGAIYEYDEAGEIFHLRAAHLFPDELADALRAVPIRRGEGAIGRLADTGEPIQIADIADQAIYQSRVREMLIRNGYRSLLAVPLLCEGRLLGGLSVNRRAGGEFAPEVVELVKTFAAQSALAIQNARLFREIEDKSRQLETASRHKSEFLANMSHELRTPLNAIIGFSEVLGERMFGEINDKQAEYVADILESGRHLLALINDILDLSKIEAGRMELEPSEFHLPTAIDNTLTLLRERAQRRGIALASDIDTQLGTVRADERKVKQVLLNLLSNALKFTPEGGRVDVRARARDGVREISVVDTGVGIAPEDLDAVFEEFRQVGASRKKAEGTGLGLAISRKFIELHGGRLWVESEPGRGATFTFTLPA